MPINTVFAARSSCSRLQVVRQRLAITATFTISAPAARIARTRSIRSAGTPSKSCDDSTIRLPPVAAISSEANAALNSTSTYSAPCCSAHSRIRRRSASESLNAPPSHSGRHVTMTGTVRPASAAVTSGSATESSRSSTRSAPASAAASRRRRSSAIVGADATMTRSGLDIKKASSTGWAEEALLAPDYVGFRPRQLPLQSGRNTTIQNQTSTFPSATTMGRGARLVEAMKRRR